MQWQPAPLAIQWTCGQWWLILFPGLKEVGESCCIPTLINRERGKPSVRTEPDTEGLIRTSLQQPLCPSYSQPITLSSSPHLVFVIHMMLYCSDPRAQRQTDGITWDYDGDDNKIATCAIACVMNTNLQTSITYNYHYNGLLEITLK